MALKKLTNGGGGDFPPTVAYYQYNKSEKPNPKIKILKKGDSFKGKFLRTFVDGDFRTHLFEIEGQGRVTIKGAKMLNDALLQCPTGTYVELKFHGQGTVQKAGRRPAHLWDVFGEISESLAAKPKSKGKPEKAVAPAEEEVEDPEIEEELSEEVPF